MLFDVIFCRSDTVHLGEWRNSNFGGDRVDARLSQPDWSSPLSQNSFISDIRSSGWSAVQEYTLPGRTVTPEVLEPNRLREAIAAKTITPMPTLGYVVDGLVGKVYLVEMERVFTGFISLRNLSGQTPGGTITIQATSVPVCGTAPAAAAAAAGRPYCSTAPEYNMQHEYVVGQTGGGTFSPRFSYHQVHFVVISGLAKAPELSQIVGHRVGNIGELNSTDISNGGGRTRLGQFHCSNPLLNKIYETSLWTKANLVTGGMSVDCPHRERL